MLFLQVLTLISQIAPTSQSVPIRPRSVLFIPNFSSVLPNLLTGPPSFTSTLLLSLPRNHTATLPVPSAKPHQHSWRPTSSRKYSPINPTHSPTYLYKSLKSLLDKDNEQMLYLLFISPVPIQALHKSTTNLVCITSHMFSQDNETFPSIPRVRHTCYPHIS